MRVAIRFAAGTEIGYGHAMRSLALAEELVRQAGASVTFFAACDGKALEWVRTTGFDCVPDPEATPSQPREVLPALLDPLPDAVVFDLPAPLPPEAVETIRAQGTLCVLVDDLGPARLRADLCFVPTRAAAEPALWRGAAGRWFCGPDYALVRAAVASARSRVAKEAYRLLVVMGGSDPGGLTLGAIDALECVRRPLLADLVLGFGFPHFARLARRLAAAEGMYFCHFGVHDMGSLIAQAHLALVAYGTVVYELAAAGLPLLTLCRGEEQEEDAARFAALGCAISLGRAAKIPPQAVASAIEELCDDRGRRLAMARVGRRAVDGQGAARAAREIARAIRVRSGEKLKLAGRGLQPLAGSPAGLSLA